MGIGVLIRYRKETDLDLEFKKVKDMQLDSCQVCCYDDKLYTAENAAVIRELIKKYELPVTTFWAGWSGPAVWNFYDGQETLGIVPPAYRGIRLAELTNAAYFTAEIGCENMATHVGFLPENPYDPNYTGTICALRALCKKMKEIGVNFLFETGQETPVTILRAIEDIGTDNVGINFDTANLILYGKSNALDAIDMFGKYILDTHIKDGLFPVCGKFLGAQKRIGEGVANIPEVVRKLKEIGYKGAYTIEREISGEEQIADIILARDYLKKLI